MADCYGSKTISPLGLFSNPKLGLFYSSKGAPLIKWPRAKARRSANSDFNLGANVGLDTL